MESLFGQIDALLDRSVGDTHQHRHTASHLTAGTFNHLLAEIVADTLGFAGSTQDEQTMYTTSQYMLNQSFQSCHVQSVHIGQGGNHRGNYALDFQ